MGEPVLLKNATDSFVHQKYPAMNFNARKALWLDNGTTGSTRWGYMYFGLPSGLYGTQVLSAKLRLWSGHRDDQWAGTVDLRAYRLTQKFAASRINWNNKPTYTVDGRVDVTKTDADDTEWEFDVTHFVQAVANGAPWYGFLVSTVGGTNNARWIHGAASRNPERRPVLEITWSDAPDAPERLIPDDGEAVSLAKPTLQWDFVDPSGDQTMQAFQMSAYSTELLADSGGVGDLFDITEFTTIPQYDTSAIPDGAWTGLADSEQMWWRVRVQDGAGLWSEWSEPSSIVRKVKGVVDILNPAASPGDYVNDPTPPFMWSFTGSTQRAYEVILTTPETPAKYLWRSGIVTDATEDTVTPPPGKITEDGTPYRVIVRVYDTEDRRATPGDPIYVSATRDFTYEHSSTVATVTSLDVAPDFYRAHAHLTWTSATPPDYFVIMRNGKVIDEVEPSEVLVAGDDYAYTDPQGRPRRTHDWSVARKVNGVVSSGNPVVSSLVKAITTNLSNEDGTDTVFLFDPQVGADRNEESEVHYILGDAPPVLVTQTQRGYEGSISGVLLNDTIPGETAASQLAKIERFKDSPGVVLRLVWVDKVLSVVTRNITDSPVPYPDGSVEYVVSFDFFEVDF